MLYYIKNWRSDSYNYWAVISDDTERPARQPCQFNTEDAANLRIGQLQILDKLEEIKNRMGPGG